MGAPAPADGPAPPRVIAWEVTRSCNLACVHCRASAVHGPYENELSTAEAFTLVDQIASFANPILILTGGDPLMLSTYRLHEILKKLVSTGTISVIRIGSRVPVTWPERIDTKLVTMLAGFDGLWLMTHFNHPAEVTPESAAACRKFVKAGIPVLNQTVLLRGVNDDAAVLEKLFRELIRIQVKPHYLFHVDPVRGVRHFATGIEKGLEMLRAFRPRLSSLAVPAFAIDLPEGGGKVALQPDYRCGDGFVSINDVKVVKYPGPLPK